MGDHNRSSGENEGLAILWFLFVFYITSNFLVVLFRRHLRIFLSWIVSIFFLLSLFIHLFIILLPRSLIFFWSLYPFIRFWSLSFPLFPCHLHLLLPLFSLHPLKFQIFVTKADSLLLYSWFYQHRHRFIYPYLLCLQWLFSLPLPSSSLYNLSLFPYSFLFYVNSCERLFSISMILTLYSTFSSCISSSLFVSCPLLFFSFSLMCFSFYQHTFPLYVSLCLSLIPCYLQFLSSHPLTPLYISNSIFHFWFFVLSDRYKSLLLCYIKTT